MQNKKNSLETEERVLIKSRSEASSPWGQEMEEGPEGEVNGDEEESGSDSDAEFAVHPILRSLIKSKSAYTIQRQTHSMKASKTSFEISLAKMLDSTTKQIEKDSEPQVVIACGLALDQKWPEPESPKKKPVRRFQISPQNSGSWSSPPNVYLGDDNGLDSEIDDERNGCWSAPEYGEEDGEDSEEDEEEAAEDSRAFNLVHHFSRSYPVIETPAGLSQNSIHLPSSSGSAVVTPSPPRPLSPVLGRPGNQARMTSSRSLQLRPRPAQDEFLSRESTGSSEDEWPQREPWPQQEVWPEEDFRQARAGWVDEEVHIPRTQSMQLARFQRPTQAVPMSRSAYSGLYDLQEVGSHEDQRYLHSHEPDHQHSDQENLPPKIVEWNIAVNSSLETAAHLGSSTHSANSQLDDTESFDLAKRTAWLERGSIVQLTQHAWGGEEEDWSRQSLHGSCHEGQRMRRSFTTEEFRKGRRKLPKRPDDLGYNTGTLTSSMSMYDRAFYESHQRQEYEEQDLLLGSRQDVRCGGVPRPPSTLNLQSQRGLVKALPPGTKCFRCTGVCSVLSLHSQSQSPMETRPAPVKNDPYAHIKTPMSPPNVLPSPHSSGRRLPPLPLHSTILSRLPTMAMPPPLSKNDHTLCFIDGMTDSVLARSTFEESYYEDDTINGNGYTRRQKKSFFSPDDSSGVSSCTTSESLNPTHRVQSAFIPRHSDELLLEIGDAVHVDRQCEDHWSYGTNLRTGMTGIFPTSVVCEIDIVEEICLGVLPSAATKPFSNERDTFYLTMLASIEVAHHKGNDVLIQAMNKVLAVYKDREESIIPQTVLMEISFRGIHIIDKKKKNFFQCPTFDFFYSLQNISFCGAHPKQLKYFGFITKHPLLPRFACHVFMSNATTQPIVESIGRAFKRSYDEYMAFAHPTEDIYLE